MKASIISVAVFYSLSTPLETHSRSRYA